jgi:hypothetical protein
MKVLLVSISIEFPLASYCLAAQVLTNPNLKGCSVEMLHLDRTRLSNYDQKNAEIWKYLATVEQLQPKVIGFSVYLWNNLATRELVSITRLVFPAIKVVLGGPEMATPEAADEWLRTGDVSVVVRGEGEQTFEEVVERFAQGDPPNGVLGTSHYSSGVVIHEDLRPPIKELGELASPFLSGLVPADLFDRKGAAPGTFSYARVLVETYRGCYMNCSFCQWGNGSKARFAFPEQRVKNEITWLLSHHVRTIFFVDAMFGFRKSSAITLLEHIVSEKRRLNAHTQFSLYHNQDFFDPDLLDLYREAGAFIEVDLQSTNREVLNKIGRGRWYTDSFDRHVGAFREQRIPTSGAADLIIGIPGDDLASFQASVDFLLQRQMRVNLYQASILPDTAWSRLSQKDGTVFSPLAPRAILKNNTFSLPDMIAARLIGHGTDLFNSFPRTAALLWRGWFERPVDLCRAVGEWVFQNRGLMYGDSHQHDWVLGSYLRALPDMIRALCPDPQKAEILVELLDFECTYAAVKWARGERIAPAKDWNVTGAEWLQERPKFNAYNVQRATFRYSIFQLVMSWDENPSLDLLDKVVEQPHVVLFYNDGTPQYFAIDETVTDQLLQRFNGYFTVSEVLNNLELDWDDLSPVWQMLSLLAKNGVITPGRQAAKAMTL